MMMKISLLLNQYEQLSSVTEKMLQMARNEQWDSLLDWQAKYQQLSDDLMGYGDINAIEQLTQPQQEMILIAIKNILNCQQQLSQLINVQHTKLGQLIGEQVIQRSQIQDYHQVASLI